MRSVAASAAFVLTLSAASAAFAEPTAVTVRVLAKDAKFIGDSMGGVEVVLSDAASGRRLAVGLTKGGTGDTKKLVVEPRVRGEPVATGAAAFTASLDLDRPTLVRATATGPKGKPASAVTVSAEMWILPGKAVVGDGWVLEMPGLVVEPSWAAGQATAKVSPMCGCPIEAGGHWDAARYEVRGALLQGGRVVAEGPLAFTGKTGVFAGEIRAPKPGRYRLRVTAFDAATANAGVAEAAAAVGH